MKMCVELGLHRQHRSNALSLKAELHKRLFWSCYWHEREIAVAMGRPPSISDHDIDVEVCDAAVWTCTSAKCNSFLSM